MPEIKHTFQGGKMNKDLDERLVPQGEYRDALNIEVRTSDGGDVGAAQNPYGNIERFGTEDVNLTTSWAPYESSMVGSVADEKDDKAYFFVASPPVQTKEEAFFVTDITEQKVFKDLILQYDTVSKRTKPVVVDIFEVHETATNMGTINGDVNGFSTITLNPGITELLKPGMRVRAIDNTGVSLMNQSSDPYLPSDPVILYVVGDNVFFDRQIYASTATAYAWTFSAQKVLNFTRDDVRKKNLITGINIIERFLTWTDDFSEPKKIHIDRCMLGTPSFNLNSTLMVDDPNSLNGALTNIKNIDVTNHGDLREEHITVVRRSPVLAPNLIMAASNREGGTSGSCTQDFTDGGSPLPAESLIPNVNILGSAFQVGDTLILDNTEEVGNPVSVRCIVESIAGIPALYTLKVESISTTVDSSQIEWSVELEQVDPLFELKMGRFGYRYEYQDGEYSTFSPWSELAFLPGGFDYVPKKGYNLGMVNTLRSLKVVDFIVEDKLRPDDVVAVDILYKDTESPNVYTVKKVRRGLDPEWTEDVSDNASTRGVLDITTEMIHQVVPSNQLLRAWDNVPRKATTQEVTGNRLVYGNYLQGFDMKNPVAINQTIVSTPHEDDLLPAASVKSIRDYKVGIVFSDKEGRESPVFSSAVAPQLPISRVDSTYVKKNKAHRVNKISAQQEWGNETNNWSPPGWIDSYKYYIKETSNEYYNLAMDRWYNAEDGNIWLSFQSADRNKVDEDTYLILKNEHGSQAPVLDEARYKILAIENEAPDYIKTTEKILGDLATGGIGLDTTMVTTFDSAAWNSMFKNIDFKGIGYARVKAVSGTSISYSQWVQIARMNDEEYQVTLTKPFGPSADIPSATEYRIQIKDDVVESMPEFDGRFFVKVFKDNTLSSNVLLETEDTLSYNTVEEFDISYIANFDENPGIEGPNSSYGWNDPGGNFNGSTISGFALCGSSSETKDFWVDHGSNGFSSFWFLDQARVDNGFTRKGLYSRSGVSGKSGMHFSNRTTGFGTGQNGIFKTKMTTPGTFFRFSDDINGVVYEVATGEGLSAGYNYPRNIGFGICKLCNESHNTCLRKTFSTDFHVKGFPDQGIDVSSFDPRGHMKHDGGSSIKIDIVEPLYVNAENIDVAQGNAIWETEPKEDVGLDLYYEATSSIPMRLTEANNESFAPVNSIVSIERNGSIIEDIASGPLSLETMIRDVISVRQVTSSAIHPFLIGIGDTVKFTRGNGTVTETKITGHRKSFPQESNTYDKSYTVSYDGGYVGTNQIQYYGTLDSNIVEPSTSGATQVTSNDPETIIPLGTFVTSIAGTTLTLSNDVVVGNPTTNFTFSTVTGYYRIDNNLYKYKTTLPWFNCYSFGNGLESDRIRDDYNAPTIDNGVKVSTTLSGFKEERRGSGLIWSGIYNSISGVNSLNEFNQAEVITKDLNPTYGTVQALKSRDTNLVVFCEDKVLKVLANKDALYNADGNVNVTASNNVLGDASGFAGDYGISKNPESLVVDNYRMYFTDKQRRSVLRLSQDGLTPISSLGMTNWFRDNLPNKQSLVGSYDEVKGEYNVTLREVPNVYDRLNEIPAVENYTVSFSEKSKGWSSFKSFLPQVGLSINDEYLTGLEGRVWGHYDKDTAANNFYGTQYESTVDVLFNDMPGSVKNFTSMNYEGSQARVTQDTSDGEYYNLSDKNGWYVSNFTTDLQEGSVPEFINKEGKWFNHIFGDATTIDNLDTSEFSVQGIGVVTTVTPDPQTEFTLTIENGGE